MSVSGLHFERDHPRKSPSQLTVDEILDRLEVLGGPDETISVAVVKQCERAHFEIAIFDGDRQCDGVAARKRSMSSCVLKASGHGRSYPDDVKPGLGRGVDVQKSRRTNELRSIRDGAAADAPPRARISAKVADHRGVRQRRVLSAAAVVEAGAIAVDEGILA